MNIPEIYLIEPYNPWAPKGRKKHWVEIVEEQALLAKIIAEHQSRTLPPPHLAPADASATAQAVPPGGGGGLATNKFYTPSMNISFSLSPTTSSAPSTITTTFSGDVDLINLNVVNDLWNYGDGSGGNNPNTTHLYTTTGSFTVQMTASAVITSSLVTMASTLVLINAPTVTAAYTQSAYTGSAPLTVQFTNLTTTNNPSNNITYNWNFGSGSNPTSSLTNPSFVYINTGSYTVVLGATGSFGITSATSSRILVTT